MSLSQIISVVKPKSVAAENFRTLKVNIDILNSKNKEKIIMVTSTGPKEGKSTVVANIAVLMAQTGKKTLILDLDLRNSGICKILGVPSGQGVASFLMDEKPIEDITIETDKENLYLISSGTSDVNASESLYSSKLRDLILLLKLNYDYIFIDTPPLMLTGDALLISNYVDGCILVVAKGEMNRSAVAEQKKLLEKINTNIMGIVFNKTKFDARGIKKSIYKKYYRDKF